MVDTGELNPGEQESELNTDPSQLRTGSHGSCSWDIATGAEPSWKRPRPNVRPPKWTATGGDLSYGRVVRARAGNSSSAGKGIKIGEFKRKQAETLAKFKILEANNRLPSLHHMHFDWWMFPIDDGSKIEFNVASEEDVQLLRSDEEWLAGYHEAVRLVTAAWGWDLHAVRRIDPDMFTYDGPDVRVAKICRSLYIFEEEEFLSSVQKFAHEVQRVEKKGQGFFYGLTCLDELLHFELPRRKVPKGE